MGVGQLFWVRGSGGGEGAVKGWVSVRFRGVLFSFCLEEVICPTLHLEEILEQKIGILESG